MIAIKTTGNEVEKYPKARPKVTLEAGPALQVPANYLTGVYEWEVTYSVKAATNIPDTNPKTEHKYGTQTAWLTFYPKLNYYGKDSIAAK